MTEEESNYIILDVRTPEEFSEKHIPGAINIPKETIGTEVPKLPDKDQLILIYCRSGNRSKQASEKSVRLGYTNIVEFGGIIVRPGETVSESFACKDGRFLGDVITEAVQSFGYNKVIKRNIRRTAKCLLSTSTKKLPE